jgi:hypothetical protein
LKISSYFTTPHGRAKLVKEADHWRDSKKGKWAHTAAILVALITGCSGVITSIVDYKEAKWRHEDSERRWTAQRAVNGESVGFHRAAAISAEATNQTTNVKESKQ